MSEIQDLLDRKLAAQGSELWSGYVNQLKMLKSLFKSERHWLLEFLQNAEDANAGRFLVRFDDEALWVMNNGHTLTRDELRSLCDVRSHKRRSQGQLGYLGLGFKSIFRLADRVDIHSGQLDFSFDRSKWPSHEPLADWPWELLPLPIEPLNLPEGFTTAFRIPTTDPWSQPLFDSIVKFLGSPEFPSEILMLLKNVGALEVQLPGCQFTVRRDLISEEMFCQGSSQETSRVRRIALRRQQDGSTRPEESHYLVMSRSVPVREDVANDRTTEEDARRSGVDRCEVGVIFGLGTNGEPITLQGRLAGVYSFLPLEGEQTGLPFGVFGDFVPDPGRDLIKYDLLWNRWLCKEIVNLFKNTMDRFAGSSTAWQLFPALLYHALPAYTVSAAGGPGAQFWGEQLARPMNQTLRQGRYYPDIHGELRTLDELLFLSPTLRKSLGDEGMRVLEESRPQKYIASDTLEPILSGSAETFDSVYDILKESALLERFGTQPSILRELYRGLADLEGSRLNYRLRGRDGRDVHLSSAPFVLGEDGLFHAPKDVFIPSTDTRNIPVLLRHVAEGSQGEGRVPLNQEIAKDPESVAQLKRCGLLVLDGQGALDRVRELVSHVRFEQDCSKFGLTYPEDLIMTTLCLLAKSERLSLDYLVSQDGHLVKPQSLFLPGTWLDWEGVWRDQYLPAYAPVHRLYTDPVSLAKCDVSEEKVKGFLQGAGVHGFDPVKDKDLVENAAYQIAETRLKNDGHKPELVQRRKELGYDIACSGHCKAVFEVKGMTEPEDVNLEPSEFKAAIDRSADYYLVCVYNLPESSECIRVIRDPNGKRIMQPVERARVPKAAWLTDA